MSWSPIDPPAMGAGKKAARAATMSMLGDSKRFAPIMRLVIRGRFLEGIGPWLSAASAVNVMAGHGEHAGQIRIEPGGSFLIAAAAGKADRGTVTIRLPIPNGVQPARRAAVPCETKHGETWLEVTLPDWAVVPTPQTQARYTGISERVPDPVAKFRGPGVSRA